MLISKQCHAPLMTCRVELLPGRGRARRAMASMAGAGVTHSQGQTQEGGLVGGDAGAGRAAGPKRGKIRRPDSWLDLEPGSKRRALSRPDSFLDADEPSRAGLCAAATPRTQGRLLCGRVAFQVRRVEE